MDYYYSKIIYNYSDFELYSYKYPISRHKIKKIQKKFKLNTNPIIKKIDYRARTNIRRILSCNITHDSKFLTLTFADNVSDLKAANLLFKLFIKRLRYSYPDFFYLAVPEFQKRGAVHYHLVINIPYIPKQEIDSLWSLGFTFIEKIQDISAIPLYLSKYITKAIEDPRYKNKKKYFTSRKCLRPVILYDVNPSDIVNIQAFDISIKKDIPMKFGNELNYKHFKPLTNKKNNI